MWILRLWYGEGPGPEGDSGSQAGMTVGGRNAFVAIYVTPDADPGSICAFVSMDSGSQAGMTVGGGRNAFVDGDGLPRFARNDGARDDGER